MIRIAICDDEKKDREKLQGLVRECESVGEETFYINAYESGEQFLEDNFKPDILFLDIIMDEKDGIQIGTEVRKRNKNIIIIYVTNIGERMAAAINQIHSYGYLMKPIVKEELFQVLAEAIKEVQCDSLIVYEKFVSENNTVIKLPVEDIFYFEYVNRKIKIVTREKTYICIKEKISEIANRMERYGFAMSHQSFVVNLYHVDKISAQSLFMRNGATVYLAQKRAAAFRKQLMKIAKESVNRGGSKG